MTSEHAAWLRRFHDATPSTTSRAYARSGSYEQLARVIPGGARVLDLACGDGHLATLLDSHRVVGVDFSVSEIRAAHARQLRHAQFVVGRAQALPLVSASIDVAACHLAFMLFDDLEDVVGELRRVVRPGGAFHAVLGGGPTADGDDVFHRFLRRAAPRLPSARAADRRARSEAGWRELFRDGWSAPTFTRHELDLSGTFDEVWQFLIAGYEREWIAGSDIANLDELRSGLLADVVELDEQRSGRLPCRVVTWLGSVRRT